MKHGRMADKLVAAKAAELEASAAPARAWPEQLVMCTDGAMVQTTTGEWREVKSVSFGHFRPYWDAKERKVVTRTEQVSYFSRVEPAEAFSRSALVEWHRRGGENAQQVVAVQDGAPWIQAFIDYHCPQAVRVIDFAHAQAYVATVGRASYGADTDVFRQWYKGMSKQLGCLPPQRTVSGLRLMQRQHPDHPEAETIETAISYLERRLSMIDYPHFRRRQLPIGSGNVESGHKVVMQRRMKQAGMRWAEASLNPMLALRVSLCNGTWPADWNAIVQRTRQEKYPVAAPPLPLLPAPAESMTVTEADCQRLATLAQRLARKKKHPWREHRWLFPHRTHLLHKN